MATIEELAALLAKRDEEYFAACRRVSEAERAHRVTEANLIERTAQLEAAAINTLPSAPVVDRQPGIDALSARIAELETERDAHSKMAIKHHNDYWVIRECLIRREAEIEELKRG